MGRVEVMRPNDMEVDNCPEMMFDAGIDALVEDGPVGFDGRPGAVPEFDFVNGQPDIVKAHRGEPGGVLVVIPDGVAIADLAEPVADVDAAQDGEAIGRGGAGEGACGPGLTGELLIRFVRAWRNKNRDRILREQMTFSSANRFFALQDTSNR